MTTTQKLLDNFKRDIDTLDRMGEELASIHYKSYQDFTNELTNGKRPSLHDTVKDGVYIIYNQPIHCKIICSRISVLYSILRCIKSINNPLEMYMSRTKEKYDYLLDSYLSIIKDYYSFTLNMGFDNLQVKVRLSNHLKKMIVELGNRIVESLIRRPETNYLVSQIEYSLKLF